MKSFDEIFKELQVKYISESNEKIGELNKLFDAYCLSKTSENLSEFRRAVHSLKGSGKSFGFPQITWVASDIEDVLKLIISDEISFDESIKELICEGLAVLAKAFKTAKDGESFYEDNYPVLKKLKEISAKKQSQEAVIPEICFVSSVKDDIFALIKSLKEYGYKVIELENPKSAKDIVVISDYKSLPEVSDKNNKIILLAEGSESISAENIFVIKKPVNFEDLLTVLIDAFGSKT